MGHIPVDWDKFGKQCHVHKGDCCYSSQWFDDDRLRSLLGHKNKLSDYYRELNLSVVKTLDFQ